MNVIEIYDEIFDVVFDFVSKLDSICCINVIVVFWFNSRFGKLGLVKILFLLLEEKKVIFWEKCRFWDIEKYKNVYMYFRFSKLYMDWFIELNVWIIFNEILNGR